MIGHAPGTPKVLSEWLYTFHIPLFFFLSGFVFSAEKYLDIKKLVATRIKTLLIPLASFSIINSVWFFVLNPSVGLKGILYTLIAFLLSYAEASLILDCVLSAACLLFRFCIGWFIGCSKEEVEQLWET